MILEAKRKAAEEEPEPKPSKERTKHKKYPLELHEEFINEIKNDEKKKKNEQNIFYHIPLFLAKELQNSDQTIHDEIVKHISHALIELKKYINRKRFLKMKILKL